MTTTGTRRTRVERCRLLTRMAEHVDAGCDVLVLSAAPGSGKTTVLQQWLAERSAAGDIVVLLTAGPVGRPADLRRVLPAAIQDSVSAEIAPAVARILDEVVDGREHTDRGDRGRPLAGTCVWLALDDAQDWSSETATEQIRRLLAAAGPGLRIAMGSRCTPHVLLSQMLVDGRAKEYRLADLAFDREEARELLGIEGVEVSDGDLDRLLDRTAGWAAGLRLAALAMARHDDHPAFVRTFAGTDRSVSDYLVSALLSGLPEDQLEVLLDVSAAERVNLDLARLLTGRPEAGSVLDGLVAQNALIGTARDDPDWYEIHPLLRSYLRAASRRRDEARFRRRQATVVDWFEMVGDPLSAIQHATAAADWPRVETLIDTYGIRVVLADGPAAMREIWQSLPARVQARPAVATSAALIASLEGSPAAADLELSVLDAAEHDAPRRLALRAMAALAGARLRPLGLGAVDDAIASLDLVSAADPELTVLGRTQAIMALAMSGDLERARDMGSAVVQVCRTRALDYALFRALIGLTAASAFESEYAAAAVYGTEAIELAQRRGWDTDPRLTSVHGQLALEAWLRYDDCGTARHAQKAVEISDVEADPVSATAALCQYDIMVLIPTDGLDLGVLGHLRAFNETWSMLPRVLVAMNACFELMTSLRYHELELAGAILRQVETLLPGTAEVPVLRAMRHVYQGHENLARQELDVALADESAFLSPWTAVTAWALAAHVADAANEPVRTHDALVNAIRVVEHAGLARVLLDATPATRELLQRHQGRYGRYEDFVAEILAMAERTPRSAGTGVALTEKELLVLRDLPSMLSLREIADAHVVSVNTIKTHMKAVYRKLGVVSRREAVDQARHLGLI